VVQFEVRTPGSHPAVATVHRRLDPVVRRLRGLGIVLLVTAVAVPLGRLVPLVGGPVFGILLGVIAGSVIPALRSDVWRPGYDFASKTLLQLSIVVLGTGLSLQQVARVGVSSLPVMLGTLALALGGEEGGLVLLEVVAALGGMTRGPDG